MKTRIAPTPSGYLHLGNLYNFILTYALAKQSDGEVGLRIDDFDYTRSRDHYIEDIFNIIDWLGLELDFGPRNLEDLKKNYSQTLKTKHYSKYIDKIPHFVCNCSRANILNIDDQVFCIKECRDKQLAYTEGKSCIRLNDKGNPLGEFVLWRRENIPCYQLISIIEDHDLKIDTIVRGMDLTKSSEVQCVLANILELNFSTIIYHHLLLKDTEGVKISKSSISGPAKSIRERFTDPATVFKSFSEFIGESSQNPKKIEDILTLNLREFIQTGDIMKP